MPTTKLYRVALVLVNAVGAALVAATQWGPGVSLTPGVIGLLTMAGNGLIVLLRQIGDPTTPTIPPPPTPPGP